MLVLLVTEIYKLSIKGRYPIIWLPTANFTKVNQVMHIILMFTLIRGWKDTQLAKGTSKNEPRSYNASVLQKSVGK